MPSSRDEVAELRRAHPEWTQIRIAREVGITRERVRQLLISQHLRTSSNPRSYRRGVVKKIYSGTYQMLDMAVKWATIGICLGVWTTLLYLVIRG
jgi:hypothetical protein